MRPFRRELKYLVHHSVKEILLERWRPYLVKAPFTNEHAVSPVLSQYYDSPNLSFYWEKLDGVGTRNKVRLRIYGQGFDGDGTAFLEIKHRKNDLVRKYRERVRRHSSALLDPERWIFEDESMRNAFMTLLERYRLRRSAQVYYQREAYEGAVEKDVRITFDTGLVGLHPGERVTREIILDRSRSLMPDSLTILEVKTTRDIPAWVHQGIVAVELQQLTIPKYISAVEVLGLQELHGSGVYA